MLSAGGNPIGLVDFFTDIYAKDVYDVMTKNKGTDKIIHPYVTVLACMTPEQTGQMLKQTIITGGFSRRVIFVYGKTQSYGVPFPKLTPEQKMAKAFIVTELLEVAKGKWKGQFLMDEEARTFFEVWYNQKHTEMFKPHPAVFKNWLKSKDVILIKIAMLLVVSEMVRPESRVIQLRHLQHGLRLLDEVEPDLTRIFAGAGRNPGAELAHKIAMRLEETGERGLARKQILALFYHEGTSKEIDEAMMFLTSTGKVNLQQTQQDPTKPGVPIYRLAATSK